MSRRFLEHSLPQALAHRLVATQNRIVVRLVTNGKRNYLGSTPLRRLGTEYGGWWVHRDLELLPSPRVLVSAGLGFDSSFDRAMLDLGFFVVGLDPLQECYKYAVDTLPSSDQMKILNLGISTFSGKEVFYEPRIAHHDSWSTINVQEVVNPTSKEFDVVSLIELRASVPEINTSNFKYLKMDIEGAELAILEKSFSEIKHYDFVAIEMDFLSLVPFLSLRKRLDRMSRARTILDRFEDYGFHLVLLENFNFFWIKSKTWS